MSYGFHDAFEAAVVSDYVPYCKIRPDPLSDVPCGRKAPNHTVFDAAVCDDCWEAIRCP